MAGLRTIATTILQKTKCQNKKEQLEKFADDFRQFDYDIEILQFFIRKPWLKPI